VRSAFILWIPCEIETTARTRQVLADAWARLQRHKPTGVPRAVRFILTPSSQRANLAALKYLHKYLRHFYKKFGRDNSLSIVTLGLFLILWARMAAVLALLSIRLRQKGSAESKGVHEPRSKTGAE
jgi:hypothetical protein